jgi:hypothetical protein
LGDFTHVLLINGRSKRVSKRLFNRKGLNYPSLDDSGARPASIGSTL